MSEINEGLHPIVQTAEDGTKHLICDARTMGRADKKELNIAKIEQMQVFRLRMLYDRMEQIVSMVVDSVPLSDTIIKAIGVPGLETELKENTVDMFYGEDVIPAIIRKNKHNLLNNTPSLIAFDAQQCQDFGNPSEVIQEAMDMPEEDLTFLTPEIVAEMNPQMAAAVAFCKGVWIDFSNLDEPKAYLGRPENNNAVQYEVFLSTASGNKSAKGFMCPANWTEESVEKYHESIRPMAISFKGMAAMLNHLTNGYIAELYHQEAVVGEQSKYVLNKVMARFGLMMSGGQSFDITDLNFSFQQIGNIELPLEAVLPMMELDLEAQYGSEETPKKAKARKVFMKNYKPKKGDGQCYIKASAMAKFYRVHQKETVPFESIVKRLIGKCFIIRLVGHTKDSEGHTGVVINKGLALVIPDDIFANHEIYAGSDVILTEDTVKLNTLHNGVIEKAWMQLCRESSSANSNNTNSQALAMFEGNMSLMNSVESIQLAKEIICGDAKAVIDICESGFHNTEDAIAALRLFQRNIKFIRKAPQETLAMKLMVLDGDASKSPIARKAYSIAAIERIRGMQNGRIPIDSSFELMVNDPIVAFPPVERFIPTGELAFGKPVYKIVLKLEDTILDGCKEAYKSKAFGQKVMTRNPIQAPGQVLQGDFVDTQELELRLDGRNNAKSWFLLYCKLEGVIISGTGIIEGILGGSDYDGDIVLCFWDHKYNQLVTVSRVACIAQDAELPPMKETLTMDNLKKSMAMSTKANAVGILSNWASAIRDIVLNVFGGYVLPQEVISALMLMSERAKEEYIKNPNSQFSEAIIAMANMNISDRKTIVSALEKSYQVTATLVMQEVDSSKSGVPVNPNNYTWLKPAYKEGKKDILVVPNHFKYATRVKRHLMGESKGKFIYESAAPLGELTRIVFDAEAKIRNLIKTSYKGELLFGEPKPEPWIMFLDKAEEYAEAASLIMDKYEGEESTKSRTLELINLAENHLMFWEGEILNNGWEWEDIAAVMEKYCLVLPDDTDKFLNIYPTEVLGPRYTKCVAKLVKGQRKHLVPVRFSESGYVPYGTYNCISDIIYKDDVAVGRVKNGIADGSYKIQKFGNICYIGKVSSPDSRWVGMTFRIFGNKKSAVDAAVLKSAIIANDGIVDVKHDFENATVTIGAVRGKLSEKDGIVGGHTFKVEIIDEKTSSLTLKVISEV